MAHMTQWVQYPWIALAVYWLITALRAKRTKERESPASFWFRIVVVVGVFEFLFSDWGRIGWLGHRFVPRTPVVAWTGVVVEILGVLLAAWARYCLGANWSGAVTLKEGHELIGAGPYKRIRHPIYSGIALGLLGTAIVIGEWRGLLAFAVIFIAHFIKARKEEAFLAREFGPSFEAHRAHTGMFLPKL
jgi:protein-S-isoprenylcysteine O-methyltransferase Ste14